MLTEGHGGLAEQKLRLIAEAPAETWSKVDNALRFGLRGLPGGSSLAILFADNRESRSIWNRPKLTIPQILAWADAFYARRAGGPQTVLARLLRPPVKHGPPSASLSSEDRGDCPAGLPCVSYWQWSGTCGIQPVCPDSPASASLRGQPPSRTDRRMAHGGLRTDPRVSRRDVENRGQGTAERHARASAGASLARLLEEQGLKPNALTRPPLSLRMILAWADAYFEAQESGRKSPRGRSRMLPASVGT